MPLSQPSLPEALLQLCSACFLAASAVALASSRPLTSYLALQPTLTALAPDVVPAGSAATLITLKGRGFSLPFTVSVQDCNGNTTNLPVPDPKHPAVRLPPALLAHPCVLRLALTQAASGLPLAVADPDLYTLSVPLPPDPNEYHPWGGEFETFCELDTTPVPAHQDLVAIVSDSTLAQDFVLGKGTHVVMRLATILPATAPTTGHCLYLALPGMTGDDVRWGPNDVEGFWLATLSSDGKSIQDLQYLADMVTEPSGPLDQN